jgi:inosine-uridine nucleoside N-ribohydrolase
MLSCGMGFPLRSLLFFSLVALSSQDAVAASARRKVIIDQDAFGPGGPNLQPIMMVLQAPDVEVLGITVESGDGWQKENVAHTLRMLEIVGRTDVPVVPGATFPLSNSQEATKRWEARYGKLFYKGAWQEEWAKEVLVRRPPAHAADVVPPLVEGDPTHQPLNETAANFLVRKVKESPGEISILAMGPMTNLALAIQKDPEFAANAKELVFMGGSFNPHAADNAFALEYVHNPRLEFNFRWDPEAASAMLHAPWRKIVQIPVDPSTRTLFNPAMIKQLSAGTSAAAQYWARWVEGFPLWDEIAAGVWLDPSLATRTVQLSVDVDTGRDSSAYGCTLSWAPNAGPRHNEAVVDVVFEVDVPRLNQRVVEALLK